MTENSVKGRERVKKMLSCVSNGSFGVPSFELKLKTKGKDLLVLRKPELSCFWVQRPCLGSLLESGLQPPEIHGESGAAILEEK